MNKRKRGKPRCSECGALFSPWDEMYSWYDGRESEYVCGDCFDALFNELNRYERAALIGSEIISAECVPPS